MTRAFVFAPLLLGFALSETSIAQEFIPRGDKRRGEANLFDARTKRVAEGALRWLARRQNKRGPQRGSWHAISGFKINEGYRKLPAVQPAHGVPHLGVTALAAMAFLSGGHLPGEGKYGRVLDDAIAFVLKHVQDNGFITDHKTRMYSHAFSLLFLTEVYGMTGRAGIKESLEKAIEFTYKSQNKEGGWRYAPLARDSDMSITVCQVVALREARNIGFHVPKETIDRALKYVLESAIVNGRDRGSFLYQHEHVPFNRNSFALTAAGLTTLFQAGIYSDTAVARFCARHKVRKRPRISDCLQYLKDNYRRTFRGYSTHYFFFYGNYYAAQAMYTRGGHEWRDWYSRIRDDLLDIAKEREMEGGKEYWWYSRNVGDHFSTAIAALILQVPQHYLPIFQR